MTRDAQLPDAGPPEEREPKPGNVSTTPLGLLLGIFLAALVLGRLVRPVVTYLDGIAPQVGWLAVGALYFGAAILGYVAWATHRTLQRQHGWLTSSQAVNRLVLAKASAIAGAVVAGGYLGYALAWLGSTSELGQERLMRSALAGVAGLLVVAGSLALERACRVRSGADPN